jgi:tetratricopeptide (TPR) repeat protein
VGRIRVRPTSAVLSYQKGPVDLQQAGATLRTDYVLAGTLQRIGETYRVRLQLVPTAQAVSTWGADVDAGRLLDVESAVADRVLAELAPRLGVANARPGTTARTSDPAAYEAFLQGRFLFSRYTSQDTRLAVAAFERALSLDPDYALAHAGLARAAAQMYIRFAPQSESEAWKARAERDAARAIELDATLGEAHEARAAVARYTEFDWERTITESQQALRLNPSLDLPHFYLAAALQHLGRLDLVEAEVAAGLEANPMNLTEALRLRGVSALWNGQFDEARSYLERVRGLAATPVSDPYLAQALYYGGQHSQADAMLGDLRGSAQAEQRGAALRASFLAARGEHAAATALIAQVKTGRYFDHHVTYSLGVAHAGLGDFKEALGLLQQAAQTGLLCEQWYLSDPLLAQLRRDPGFARFIADVRATAARTVEAYRRPA